MSTPTEKRHRAGRKANTPRVAFEKFSKALDNLDEEFFSQMWEARGPGEGVLSHPLAQIGEELAGMMRLRDKIAAKLDASK